MLLNNKAPRPGQIKTFPTLARTFREVAEHGKDGFYKGRVAEALVELIQSKGGVMELEDLAEHASTRVEPIKYTYGGEVTIYEVRPRLIIDCCLLWILTVSTVSSKWPRFGPMSFETVDPKHSSLFSLQASRRSSPSASWRTYRNRGKRNLCLRWNTILSNICILSSRLFGQ